jgi:hypothetical protein
MKKKLQWNCAMLFHSPIPSWILIHTCAYISNPLWFILTTRFPTNVSLGSIPTMFITPKPCSCSIKNPKDGFYFMLELSNLWTIWCSNGFWVVRFWLCLLLLKSNIFYAYSKPILRSKLFKEYQNIFKVDHRFCALLHSPILPFKDTKWMKLMESKIVMV